jgi:chaperonin GroES
MKIRPLSGYLLIEPEEEATKTAAGIYLPETATEKQQIGKVVAVGPPRLTDEGKKIPPEVGEGDKVIFAKWGGEEVKDPKTGKELKLVKFEDVKAKVI